MRNFDTYLIISGANISCFHWLFWLKRIKVKVTKRLQRSHYYRKNIIKKTWQKSIELLKKHDFFFFLVFLIIWDFFCIDIIKKTQYIIDKTFFINVFVIIILFWDFGKNDDSSKNKKHAYFFWIIIQFSNFLIFVVSIIKENHLFPFKNVNILKFILKFS